MVRALRIEYPGAVYHVLNRGNYRRHIFSTEGSKKSFEKTLFDACRRYNWLLHGYCILSNHYHIAVETVDGNLSAGMQWLQSTYANRFNKLHKSNGHLFQGRYRSLVVEKDEYLGPLLHYIHLNPLRAKLISSRDISRYRWSSLWYLNNKRKRPDWLRMSSCLYYAGELADTSLGRRKYLEYLGWLSADSQECKELRFEKMCQGWALGTREYKKKLVGDYLDSSDTQDIKGKASVEARDLYYEHLLERILLETGKGQTDIMSDKKCASWKVLIAYFMKKNTGVSNGWLSEHLHMGTVAGVSRYVSEFEGNEQYKSKVYKGICAKINT